MKLNIYERKRILTFIENRTDYQIAKFSKMSDSQLFAVYKRIEQDLIKKANAIETYYKNNPESRNFTSKELLELGLTELNAICQSLGINSSRKKVLKSEKASEEVLSQAEQELEQKDRTHLAAQMIISSSDKEDILLDPISDSFAIKQYFGTVDEALAAGYASYSDEYRYERRNKH